MHLRPESMVPRIAVGLVFPLCIAASSVMKAEPLEISRQVGHYPLKNHIAVFEDVESNIPDAVVIAGKHDHKF